MPASRWPIMSGAGPFYLARRQYLQIEMLSLVGSLAAELNETERRIAVTRLTSKAFEESPRKLARKLKQLANSLLAESGHRPAAILATEISTASSLSKQHVSRNSRNAG